MLKYSQSIKEFFYSVKNKLKDPTFWPNEAKDWVELIGKTLLILASIGAAYQYFELRDEKRINKAHEYLKDLNTGYYSSAWVGLLSSWNEAFHLNIKSISGNYKTKKDVECTEECNFDDYIKKHTKSNPRNSEYIDLIVIYFDNLQTCIEIEACDKNTAQNFVGNFSYKFFKLYRPIIREKRRFNDDYGKKLQDFAYQTMRDRQNFWWYLEQLGKFRFKEKDQVVEEFEGILRFFQREKNNRPKCDPV